MRTIARKARKRAVPRSSSKLRLRSKRRSVLRATGLRRKRGGASKNRLSKKGWLLRRGRRRSKALGTKRRRRWKEPYFDDRQPFAHDDYNKGYDQGYDEAYPEGFDQGYNEGKEQGQQENYSAD